MRKGYIQIYTGDGKGKTTAALGLTFRAAGRGMNILFVQFLKGIETGELISMGENPHIVHLNVAETTRFFHTLNPKEQQDLKDRAKAEWADLKDRVRSDRYDILVLDEIMAALQHGLVEENDVLSLLHEKPEEMEIILTGRNATENLKGAADLVTEMRKIKHYYDEGIVSRMGIEY